MWKTRCWLVSLLWPLAVSALEPHRAINQFVHTSWTENEGAPGPVYALAQTTDGYLWLGTANGLFRFDGVRFTRFEPPAGEELPEASIRTLMAARDGGLWLGFSVGQVCHLLNGHLKCFALADVPAVRSVIEERDGGILAATDRGLYRFQHGRWTDAGEKWNSPKKPAWKVFLSRNGTLWVAVDRRILFLPPGQDHFQETGERTVELCTKFDFAESPDGTIWLAELTRSLRPVWAPGSVKLPTTEIRVGASSARFDAQGSLWVASVGDGLRRLAFPDRVANRKIAQFGPEAEQFTKKDGLSGDYVFTSLQDREHNLWFGTARGLDRFRDNTFVPVQIRDGDQPNSIVATQDGNVWVGASNRSFLQRIGPDGVPELLPHSVPNVLTLQEDGPSAMWISHTGGLSRIAGSKTSVPFKFPHGLSLMEIWAMTKDREGGLWLIDRERGAFRLAGGKVTSHAEVPGLPRGPSIAYTDPRGDVWLGFVNATVALYREGKFRMFEAKDGIVSGRIFAIFGSRAGQVWVGGDAGLTRYENGVFRGLTKRTGFPTEGVYGIVEDDSGLLWLATDAGVVRLDPREFEHALANPGYRAAFNLYDQLDGLPGHPRKGFPFRTVARANDGRVWFTTTNGLAFVDPRHLARNEMPPPVHVETVKADGKAVSKVDGIVLPAHTHDLQIDYTALSLSIPEHVLFRYKLEGADADWQEAGTRRQAYYNNLSPKQYSFRVTACNQDGVWNEMGDSWGFSVSPAFYQTSWFRLLCALAGATIIWAFYRLRLQQMTAQVNLRYKERLAERTRIARELHDTLLQSLAGVSLQLDGISKQIVSAPEAAASQIRFVREQVDACFREARLKVWDLRSPELEKSGLPATLRDFLERIAPVSKASCKLTVTGEPRPWPVEVEEQLLRIAQEAVNNAVRHAEPNEIGLALCYEAERLRLKVRDDGRGFDFDDCCLRVGHWGLQNMRDRAAQIGAQWNITTAAGRGTEIEVRVVLPRDNGRSTNGAAADSNPDR